MSGRRKVASLLALLAMFLAPAFAQGPVQIETGADLPDGRVNVAYLANLSARRGNLPYSWSVVSGTLPPGIALVALTGTLAGLPTSSGEFTFTIRVTDRNNEQDSRQFHLTRAPFDQSDNATDHGSLFSSAGSPRRSGFHSR